MTIRRNAGDEERRAPGKRGRKQGRAPRQRDDRQSEEAPRRPRRRDDDIVWDWEDDEDLRRILDDDGDDADLVLDDVLWDDDTA